MLRSEYTQYANTAHATNSMEAKHSEYVVTDATFSAFSVLYENIRTSLNRSDTNRVLYLAVARIYARLFSPGQNPQYIGKVLIEELIRSGYIANGTLPVEHANQLQGLISAHAEWLEQQLPKMSAQQKPILFRWTVQVVARLLAYKLDNYQQKLQFAYTLQQVITPSLFRKHGLPNIRPEQVTLAIMRAHYGLDNHGMAATMLLVQYPNLWQEPQLLLQSNIHTLHKTVNEYDTIPLQADLRKTMIRLKSVFMVVERMLQDYSAEQLVQFGTNTTEYIQETITKVFNNTKAKVWRILARSALAIIIVKIVYAAIVDIPVDIWLLGEVKWLPVIANIIFHPLLLIAMGVVLRTPKRSSQLQLAQMVDSILFEGKPPIIPLLSAHRVVSSTRKRVFNLLYGIVILALLGLFAGVLAQLEFTLVGSFTFSIFVAITMYIGAKQRQTILALYGIEHKPSLLTALIDVISIPLINAGKVFTDIYSKYNILVFIMDVCIEAPLKLLLDALEQWRAQLREERERLQL